MQIAITSQNRRSITEHAGKCRNFWIYEIDNGRIGQRHLVELPIEQSLHASRYRLAEPLAGIDVLICGSMGGNLHARLRELGIVPVITAEENPDKAVQDYLQRQLKELPVDQ